MANRAVLAGVDISSTVVTWGRLEQVKEALLAEATLFTSEMSLEVANGSGAFRASGLSLAAGLSWYGQVLEIFVDEVSVYRGFVKNIAPDPERGTARIATESVMRRAADANVVGAEDGVNPGVALLAVLRAGFELEDLDVRAILAAGAPARAAGATIDYSFSQGSRTTVLSAVQDISRLCSISVFVAGNHVTARAFRPYQGDGAGLRHDLGDLAVRAWGPMEFDELTFNDRVVVGHADGPGYVELNDRRAQRINGTTKHPRQQDFSATASVVCTDAESARFFGRTYLARTARRPAKVRAAGGDALRGVLLGDRFPVTQQTRLGVSSMPAEVYTAYLNLDTREVELHLAQLFGPSD